ncbi:uncharacterized protein PFL1_05681 [Pseudozyma flocculosa PF-1]|uniref:GH16 domain-containing protein n=2 Tax=Pseudozyma flocculosa TaxID=84751 RepID=A0A5C3FBF2_9BASI|nr:uncharacterized protein PFL1_05681 [Pseudozyma flocculosa PF-1]EPQ26702.1 hypothetical protein PFL1_05681 [Pseudozyma flocculosa PF-1]SPO40977.1 uncharacterized protein PSFLO_06459 [Pseudozyma flocculosa]
MKLLRASAISLLVSLLLTSAPRGHGAGGHEEIHGLALASVISPAHRASRSDAVDAASTVDGQDTASNLQRGHDGDEAAKPATLYRLVKRVFSRERDDQRHDKRWISDFTAPSGFRFSWGIDGSRCSYGTSSGQYLTRSTIVGSNSIGQTEVNRCAARCRNVPGCAFFHPIQMTGGSEGNVICALYTDKQGKASATFGEGTRMNGGRVVFSYGFSKGALPHHVYGVEDHVEVDHQHEAHDVDFNEELDDLCLDQELNHDDLDQDLVQLLDHLFLSSGHYVSLDRLVHLVVGCYVTVHDFNARRHHLQLHFDSNHNLDLNHVDERQAHDDDVDVDHQLIDPAVFDLDHHLHLQQREVVELVCPGDFYLTATSTTTSTVTPAPTYSLMSKYSGRRFYDNFYFFTYDDPTHGKIEYVGRDEAKSLGLISMSGSQVYMGYAKTLIWPPTSSVEPSTSTTATDSTSTSVSQLSVATTATTAVSSSSTSISAASSRSSSSASASRTTSSISIPSSTSTSSSRSSSSSSSSGSASSSTRTLVPRQATSSSPSSSSTTPVVTVASQTVTTTDATVTATTTSTSTGDSATPTTTTTTAVPTPTIPAYKAVRVSSYDSFSEGIFVLDASHMPVGCGLWPAFWTVPTNPVGSWPNGGEIDIVEGVHDYSVNTYSIHTARGCTVNATTNTQLGTYALSNLTMATNCASFDTGNEGCGVRSNRRDDYGKRYNANGGGIHAMVWDTDTGIRSYFWPRSSMPADLASDQPDPSTWGTPIASWPATNCDMETFFASHVAVFTNTACGDWAGNDGLWHTALTSLGQKTSCAAQTGYSSCRAYMESGEVDMSRAYWLINSVKIYQTERRW